jgi:predicted ester cyclase
MISTVCAGFPELQQTLDDQIAEGDKVVNRWTARGTHRGAYMGFAPTGKSLTFTGITIFSFAQGKIVEQWVEQDMMGFMRQLGAGVH